ncbi:MAG: hypothetical protein FD170_3940 [Bacteroidetes bacterium]|nr:MAG: hypothetical protein FD170_3940 [Bacteroidota bacterium]
MTSKTSKRLNGIVIATKEQMLTQGIVGVPHGALVQLYEIDEHETTIGPGSKMRYKYEMFDFIIPTCWVLLSR